MCTYFYTAMYCKYLGELWPCFVWDYLALFFDSFLVCCYVFCCCWLDIFHILPKYVFPYYTVLKTEGYLLFMKWIYFNFDAIYLAWTVFDLKYQDIIHWSQTWPLKIVKSKNVSVSLLHIYEKKSKIKLMIYEFIFTMFCILLP